MKSGIELIAQERKEQMEKHGITIEHDIVCNSKDQLIWGAYELIGKDFTYGLPIDEAAPFGWDLGIFAKMYDKPLRDRLIIAGALIAAEIDRLQNIK
jgi:hypothetical protein